MRVYDSAEKGLENITRIMNYVGTVCLAIMMFVTVADVFGRYIFNEPLQGSIEIIEYLMVTVACMGLAWCALRRRNPTVDLVVMNFHPRVQAVLDVITHCLCLSVYLLLAWQAVLESRNMKVLYHKVSDVLEIPAFPFQSLLALGFICLCLAIIARLVQLIGKVVSP